jgi:hypothetical protein
MQVRRVIPLIFIVISLLYILFSFSLEERRMIGDVKGWDPGSRAMPVGVGFIMLTASVYLAYKEKKSRGEDETSLELSIRKLMILTILLSILYILFFRFLGFVLSTHILLFTLIYFNYESNVKLNMIPSFSIGILLSTGLMLLFYSIGRYITRLLFLSGRRSDLPILSGKLFTVGIPFFVLLILFVTLLFLLKKTLKNDRFRITLTSGFTAIGLTELLYIVFKQVFLVSLAKGLIGW